MKVESKSEYPMTDADARDATGKAWEDWFRAIDANGGPAPGRRAITDWLMKEHGLAPWWAQTIAVEYERTRGVREKDGRPKGYAICVTKTIAAPADRVFDAFGDPALMREWLGPGAKSEFAEGGSFSTSDGGSESMNERRIRIANGTPLLRLATIRPGIEFSSPSRSYAV